LGYVQDSMLSALSAYRHTKRDRFVGVLGYLHVYGKLSETFKTNLAAKHTYDGAKEHAFEKGYKLADIDITLPDLTSGRLTEILRARGIKGVILNPLTYNPGPLLPLVVNINWSYFSLVSITQNIVPLRSHCVAPNHAHTMQLQLDELRKLGYQKIGLQMRPGVNSSTKGSMMGAFMADQITRPKAEWVPPLFAENVDAKMFDKWFRKHRPDCIIASGPKLLPVIEELGYRMPDDFGLAFVSRAPDSAYAGCTEQHAKLGAAAVDSVISQLQSNEQGLPLFPRVTLIEGTWVWQPTLRRNHAGT
jgi:LacI family transcriptional regulator